MQNVTDPPVDVLDLAERILVTGVDSAVERPCPQRALSDQSASADSPFATGFQPVVTRLVSWFEPASAGLWVGLQTLALIWLKPQFQAG